MVKLTLIMSKVVKLHEYLADIILPIGGLGDFKVALKCNEDVSGGRVFELTIIRDKYDEVKPYTYTYVKGFITYATLKGQREFFEKLKSIVNVDKYYVSPWDVTDVYIDEVDLSPLTKSENELANIIRKEYSHLRSGRGWLNYIKKYPSCNLTEKLRNLSIELTVTFD